MKVIDLLNKIANGDKKLKNKYEIYINTYLHTHYVPECLNDEVEIIEEEKEIEEINLRYVVCKSDFADLHIVDLLNNFFKENDNKINELVRELNKIMKEGK